MAYLYQDINKVPGLSGDSYSKQRQLYEAMGSPQGPYRGSYDQNIWLLNQIQSGAAQQAMAGGGSSSSSSGGSINTSIVDQYMPPAPDPNQPFFPSLTEQWDLIQPAAMNAAAQAVDPELQRNYNTSYGNLTRGLAQSGAGSFGRGLGQIGSLQAETQRNRAAQLYDVANQYKKGFEELYYNPTWEAWKRSLTNAKPGEVVAAPGTPTWDEFYKSYGGQMGPNIAPNAGYRVGLNYNNINNWSNA